MMPRLPAPGSPQPTSWACRALSLADRLTTHLVREIIVRGSGGGPLAPLADQFNHELTRLRGQLQGQRIEGMLVRLAGEVRDALARPGSTGYRCRCLSLRFLMRLPQVAMSHQAPARLWERS